MLKDSKNLLANSSGPLKECRASKGHTAEFLIGSVFCLLCVQHDLFLGTNCQVVYRNNGIRGNGTHIASKM